MEGQEQLMANGSPKPLTEDRGTGTGGSGGGSKVANMRFMTPYSSAYSGDPSGKDCEREDIPLSQAVEFHSATTPTGQTSKREIYLPLTPATETMITTRGSAHYRRSFAPVKALGSAFILSPVLMGNGRLSPVVMHTSCGWMDERKTHTLCVNIHLQNHRGNIKAAPAGSNAFE
ncbi:hypothetical protein F7725_010601, partial [Dissostichus mawsoni]